MDLKELVISSFDNIAAGEFIQKTIEENLQKTIKSTIEDVFGGWSKFSKELKQLIESNVKVGMHDLVLPMYSKTVLNLVQNYVDECIYKEGLEKMKADLQVMLIGKTEYKLSEIVDSLKNDFADEAREDGWDEITLIIKDEKDGFVWISLDPEPDKDEHRCSTRIMTYKGKVSSVHFKEKDFKKQFFIGDLHGYEKLLFNLYASEAILEINEAETYYSSEDEDY